MGFSDWSVFTLFISGLLAIIYFGEDTKIVDRISIIVLWFTAIVIMQYTKETYELKQINIKQLNHQKRPILKIFYGESSYSLMLKNIGKGAAINIELRISQIHPNGGFTNLRVFSEDKYREFFNLGEGEEQYSSYSDIIEDYQRADKPDFSSGVMGVFAVIATYEDIGRNPYYTISLFKTDPNRIPPLLKTTKIGSYKSGELEKIFPTDWLK